MVAVAVNPVAEEGRRQRQQPGTHLVSFSPAAKLRSAAGSLSRRLLKTGRGAHGRHVQMMEEDSTKTGAAADTSPADGTTEAEEKQILDENEEGDWVDLSEVSTAIRWTCH